MGEMADHINEQGAISERIEGRQGKCPCCGEIWYVGADCPRCGSLVEEDE